MTPVPVARVVPKPDPRKKAAASGLLALADQLAELRDMDVDRDVERQAAERRRGREDARRPAYPDRQGGDGQRWHRRVEASQRLRRRVDRAEGQLDRQASRPPTVADSNAPEAQRSGKSGKAARTREEIELVFDKNKSAIYAMYSRALRDNPALQGKVVLEVTIAPTGEVTECRVISSELGDPELERKLVARVRMFRFESRDVAVDDDHQADRVLPRLSARYEPITTRPFRRPGGAP